jgi:hypothetical protein
VILELEDLMEQKEERVNGVILVHLDKGEIQARLDQLDPQVVMVLQAYQVPLASLDLLEHLEKGEQKDNKVHLGQEANKECQAFKVLQVSKVTKGPLDLLESRAYKACQELLDFRVHRVKKEIRA